MRITHAVLGRAVLFATMAFIVGTAAAGIYLIARHPEGLRGAPRAQERTKR